ncbi:MAG: branched-chain amino acid ABC transporter substrate-binding protein [Planctomycetes bacterium]|nr:branched-chain amino acid ABC transporter substrate-binding protein [Planctomycetota bacterium]
MRPSLVALVLSFALTAAHAADNVLTIVSSFPRTGSANAQTTTIVNGIRMAIEEAGGAITLGGTVYQLNYLDWDDASPEKGQWDPAVEGANADKAIRDPDVMAYIGTYNSGAAKIAMPKLNQAGLVMVSPANTATGLTKPGQGEKNEPDVYRPSGKVTYFRIVPADDIQGEAAAKWAKEMGVAKAYVLHDKEVYGRGVAESFKRNAEKIGIAIAGIDGIDGKASNYRSLITKIRQHQPQLVYFGGTTQNNAGQIAKDMVSGGLDAKLMVPDGCYENAFITSAGAQNLDGRAFVTFCGAPPAQLTGKGKTFVEAYRKKFSAEPEAYAAYGYEAANVVIDAIRRAGKKDRAAIVAAVAATKDFDGALGKWSFDANGDTTQTVVSGNTVKGGAFEFVKLLGE